MNTVIVAIPAEDDYTWKVSSEKIPHLTMLFLDDLSQNPNLDQVLEYVQHVVSTSADRFSLSVDHRGTLGPDQADVVFFEKDRTTKKLDALRQDFLKNQDIFVAHEAVDQYPEWTPHLTLGYPTAPAKPDQRDYPGISYVNFDRIAFWTGDFEGPEFLLERRSEDLLMSAESSVEKTLKHHGVLGQRWGVRKPEGAPPGPASAVVKRTTKRGIKTTGGQRHPASEDATNAALGRRKAKASGTHALSNKELQSVVQRMNLEQQFRNLSKQQQGPAKRFISKLLGQQAGNLVTSVATNETTKVATTIKDKRN